MRCATLLLATASLLTATLPLQTATADAAGKRPGYTVSLFDGQTLNGWSIENDCEVEVQDGMILAKAGNGWLCSDHTYTDFHLHVEWKALQAENYDAGVYVRTRRGGSPFPKESWQANILQGQEGNISKLKGASSTGLARPAGEWNSFDITVVGDTITMVINGQPAYSVGGITTATGHVGLQVEVPKGGQVLFRNIHITEFDYTSLFNGKDLTGWEGGGRPANACWLVVDGLLRCNGQKGPWLRSRQQYDNFNLRFDYRLESGGNSGVYVRVPAGGAHHRSEETEPEAGYEIQLLDDFHPKYEKLKDYQYCGSVYAIAPAKQRVGRPAGEWNSFEINCNGYRVTVRHNGVVIVDADADAYPLLKLRNLHGWLGLQNHSSVVDFRSLRIGPALDNPL